MTDKSTTTHSLCKFYDNEEKIYRALFGEYENVSLMTAINRKMFDIVRNNEGITKEELIEKAKLGPRAGEAVVAVVTALGYLQVVDKKYSLTEYAEEYFPADPDKNWSMLFKEFLHCSPRLTKTIDDENNLESWQTETVDTWKTGESDAETSVIFSRMMDIIHVHTSELLAKNVNFHEQFGIKSIMDVGGGSGCYSLAIAKHQPGMRSTVCDLENVCKAAQPYIEKVKLPAGSKVSTFPGDMFKGIFPKHDDPEFGYQAVFLSDIIHDWDQKSVELICKNVYEALPEGGYIILNEMLFNDDYSGPLVTALMSFNMFLMTPGKQRSFAELRTLLKTSGFSDICKTFYGVHHSLVIGKKSTK